MRKINIMYMGIVFNENFFSFAYKHKLIIMIHNIFN